MFQPCFLRAPCRHFVQFDALEGGGFCRIVQKRIGQDVFAPRGGVQGFGSDILAQHLVGIDQPAVRFEPLEHAAEKLLLAFVVQMMDGQSRHGQIDRLRRQIQIGKGAFQKIKLRPPCKPLPRLVQHLRGHIRQREVGIRERGQQHGAH